MALVYITGASGAGKSTVRTELQRRDYLAYDTDEDGLSRWFDARSGAEVPTPPNPSHRDDNWFANHTYRLPPQTVQHLATEAGDTTVFICGTVGNEDQIWNLFSTVICLSIDAETLRQRLTQRPAGFGSTENDLQRILTWHANVDADNSRFGAILIDASPPVTEVVDHLLTQLDLPRWPDAT